MTTLTETKPPRLNFIPPTYTFIPTQGAIQLPLVTDEVHEANLVLTEYTNPMNRYDGASRHLGLFVQVEHWDGIASFLIHSHALYNENGELSSPYDDWTGVDLTFHTEHRGVDSHWSDLPWPDQRDAHHYIAQTRDPDYIDPLMAIAPAKFTTDPDAYRGLVAMLSAMLESKNAGVA